MDDLADDLADKSRFGINLKNFLIWVMIFIALSSMILLKLKIREIFPILTN